jgi:hemolysin III
MARTSWSPADAAPSSRCSAEVVGGANEPRFDREELANALTHGVGVVASVAGGAVLITLVAIFGDALRIATSAVFVTGLVLLYTASTLYHAVRGQALRARLRVLDHCAIFLMIAATYTPFTLLALPGALGEALFATIWALAVVGIAFKCLATGRYRAWSTAFYVAMGWLVVVAIEPLARTTEPATLAFLVGGGVAYTAGTPFYHATRIPYHHAVWHGFVLLGSVLHFAAVLTLSL